MTNNITRRFGQHQKGQERTTSPYKPFEIVYTEVFPTRSMAREREKHLKSGVGKEWLKQNI